MDEKKDVAKTVGIPADLDINVLLQRLTSVQEASANRLEGNASEPIDNDMRK